MEQLKTAVDVNEALLQSSGHQVDQALASLDNAKSLLDKTTIHAPMSGRVTRLDVEQGETAIQGTLNKDAATLLTISDMSVLETKVKVDETDVARIVGWRLGRRPDRRLPRHDVHGARHRDRQQLGDRATTTTASTDQAIDYEVTIRLLNSAQDTSLTSRPRPRSSPPRAARCWPFRSSP